MGFTTGKFPCSPTFPYLCSGTFQKGREMKKFCDSVKKFLKSEDGPTAVEYAVMLALIIVVCLAAITTLGTNANTTFTSVGNAIGGAGGSGTGTGTGTGS